MGSPIIFPDPMIRALRAGYKTQTRLVMKPQPSGLTDTGRPYIAIPGVSPYEGARRREIACPYGGPGDLIWVRETWGAWPHMMGGVQRDTLAYRATDEAPPNKNWRWRSPVCMPRWASRITLRLTDVRVQRVQEISGRDALCESGTSPFWGDGAAPATPRDVFACLWDNINAKRGYPWKSNPWVWALSFEVILRNISEV